MSRVSFIIDPGKKIPKKIAKKFNKLKNIFPALFLGKTGLDWPRKWEKNFSPEFRLYSTRQENSEKNSKKIQKIRKSLPDIIFSQNGNEIAQKREKKNFNPEFRSYSVEARKFRKKYYKNSKNYKTYSWLYF